MGWGITEEDLMEVTVSEGDITSEEVDTTDMDIIADFYNNDCTFKLFIQNLDRGLFFKQ